MADLKQLPSKVSDAVQKVKNIFSSLSLQDAKTADKPIKISDNLTSGLGSDYKQLCLSKVFKF